MSFVNSESSGYSDKVLILIANLSNNTLVLNRLGNPTNIGPKIIDYYYLSAFDLKYNFYLLNGEKAVNVVHYDVSSYKTSSCNVYKNVAPKQVIFRQSSALDEMTYGKACIIMDA